MSQHKQCSARQGNYVATLEIYVVAKKTQEEGKAKNIAIKPQQSKIQGMRLLCRDIDQLYHDKDAWKAKQVNVATNLKQN